MVRSRVAKRRTEFHAGFASRCASSLLEINASIPSEINAISPLVDLLIRLIEGSRCISSEEHLVQIALREALNNAVVHGNRLDARKLVHVRCCCKVGDGIWLIVSDQGQGFDVPNVPDSVAAENLEADHGRGIHLMKSAMDEVWFEKRGTEVHMWKRPARNARAGAGSGLRGR